MKSARSVCVLWLLAGVALSAHAHAQETKSRATKPASSATSAAKPAADAASSAADDDAKEEDEAKEDEEFLEFLGSVDSDATDEDWLDYLAQTDILKVAKAKKKAQAAAESRPAPDKAGK